MTVWQFVAVLVIVAAVVLVGIQLNKWVIKTAIREALWEHETMMAALEEERKISDGPQ